MPDFGVGDVGFANDFDDIEADKVGRNFFLSKISNGGAGEVFAFGGIDGGEGATIVFVFSGFDFNED